MLAEPVTLGSDGLLRVPNTPGVGVRLDEETVAFYAQAAGDPVSGR